MTPAPPRVSVLVPAYNEARTIDTVLRAVCRTPIDKEVIVINDGSTDGTGEILERLQQELPIRVITHPKNLGKGQAIRTGIQHSTRDVVLIQDADLECDPAEYPGLLAPMMDERVKIVYGSRFHGVPLTSGGHHRLGNWVITAMVNLLFGSSLTDAETGYKVFRRMVVAPMQLRALSFDFEVEFTCKALRLKHAIVEVPVAYTRRRSYAEGKKITWKDGVRALWVITRCRFTSAAAPPPSGTS
ncbi:MAG: glycosyltransferase family 2 protein [Candidatus Omnitrophica bacterium]|nr:glycosyltransferase family 2 protein [Candidatus Omnitrophota bacterium]